MHQITALLLRMLVMEDGGQKQGDRRDSGLVNIMEPLPVFSRFFSLKASDTTLEQS